MKHPLLLLVGLVYIPVFLLADASPPQPVFPPFGLANTQLRALPRSANGRDYLLYVALPASYQAEAKKKYPVLYMTDGYWSFTLLNGLYSALVYDRVVPEFIIVGLGYAGENLNYGKMRQWDLSPTQLGQDDSSGHAAEFLTAIEHEIIPFVEREYRADPAQRALGGASLGGLFSLYAMYTKPGLFNGYIAVSPAVNVGNNWLFDYEEAFTKAGKPLKTRLFMSAGGNEWAGFQAGIKRFHERITSRKSSGLNYQFRLIEGERHGGTNAEADNRALRFIFEPLAPETGQQRD
jgi:predicted alpha/beta superfamily hydrolase